MRPRGTALAACAAWLLAGSLGCGDHTLAIGPGGEPADPIAPMAASDAAVIADIAKRKDLDEAQAKQRAEEALLLARAAQQDLDAQGKQRHPIPEARRRHLRRSALARITIEEQFLATHGVDAMDTEAPAAKAMKPNYDHPTMHLACQLVFTPADEDTRPDDPRWQRIALAYAAGVREVAAPYLREPKSERCWVLQELVKGINRDPEADDPFLGPRLARPASVKVHMEFFPRKGNAQPLDACQPDEPATDADEPPPAPPPGTPGCKRMFDKTWTDAVAALKQGEWSQPFTTRFAVHVVHLVKIVEAVWLDDDPKARESWLEEAHRYWVRQQFNEWIAEVLRVTEAGTVQRGAP